MTFEELREVNAAMKTVNIKGKEYVPVQERITAFRKVWPHGFIRTELLSVQDGICIMRAEVGATTTDGTEVVFGTGTAYEKETSSYINKTSYIENCETSAVGRALGMAGFGIDTSVASFEEVANAITQQEAQKAPKRSKARSSAPEPAEAREIEYTASEGTISEKQWKILQGICRDKAKDPLEILLRYGYGRPSEVPLEVYDDMIKALEEGTL